MKRKITLVIVAAAPAAIALIVAGVVSFASGSPSSSAPYGSTAQASAPNRAAGAAAIATASSPLGRIVVDSRGRTLYLFEKDENRRSACYEQCATSWPPLLTDGKPVARGGVNQALLGRIRRADGSEQVSYAGHPLYRFLGDRKPGQTTGEGSQAFGAGWEALSPAGEGIEAGG
jgi:predicted lipoprotein with Yx(FWY)xxD motif